MRRGGGGRKASNHLASSHSEQQQYHHQQQQQHQQQHQGYDVHHNNDSPCCRMLYNVARQIIPLSPFSSSNSSSSNEAEQDGDAEILLPPLLAKMLQEHILQEHEAIILASSSSEQGKVSASKKKKKKKKKKKSPTDHQQPLEQEEAMIIPLEKQGNEDDDFDANATTTSTTATSTCTTTTFNAAPTVVTPNDKKKKSKHHHEQQYHEQRQQDPSPSSGDEILMLKPSSSSTIDAANNNIDATPASTRSMLLPVNKRIMNPWLQDFLTTFRQSMDENEQQQQNQQQQQAPSPTTTTTTTTTTTPTRELQDFLDFLSRTSSQQQQPKNTKSSSSSSSYHVTLHQVQEHAIRPVDCPCCTSVLQRYFQHATTIPLLPSLNAIYDRQERLLLQSNNNNNNLHYYNKSRRRRQRPQHYYNSRAASAAAAADPQHHYQHLHNVNTSSPASLFGLDDDDNDGYDNYNQYHRNYHNRSRSDDSGDNNDQHAFDYVAMEEGILQQEFDDDEPNLNNNNDTLSSTPCLAFVKVSADQKKSGWQLRRMDHDIHNNNNNGSSSTPMTNWTMNDLNFILQEYILMGGLGHDELVAATSTCCNRRLLSDEQFIDIVENVQVRYSKVLEELTQCISEILRHETTLKELTASSNGGGFGDVAGGGGGAIVGNIDMTGPTTMMDIDSNVCTVLGRLLQIVLNVTESYQTIGLYLNRTSTNSSSSNHKLPRHVPHLLTNDGVIMSMWQVYLKAFGDIVANTLTFEQKLFSIADRHGKINPFFYSGTARQFLYELVQNKVRIVVYAVDSIKRHLDDRLDVVETAIGTYRPTFMRSIFTYEAFLAMIGATNNGEEQRAKSSPLDHACTDVLFEMREWSETVQESSIANILDKHRARRDRLFRLLQIAQKQFQTDMETVNKSSDTTDTRLPGDQVLQSMGQPLTALLEKYSEITPDTNNNTGDDQGDRNSQEALAALRGQLPCTMLSSIRLWLSLSVNPLGQNGGQASPTAAMPLKLVQFLIARAKEDFDPTSCRGPDGTVRAALAMTALFCRWLSDRFHEWHAELVQQELLTAMEDEHQQPAQTSAASSTTNTKSAKKSKKKKAKTSLATVSSSSLSEDMASKDQSLGGGGSDTRSTNGSKIPTNGDTAAADVQGKSKSVVAPTNGDAAAAASAAALDSHEKQEAGDASTRQPDPETKDAMHSSLPPQQPDVDVSHLESKTSITAPTDNSNCGSNKGINDADKEQPNGNNAPPGQEGNSYSDSGDVVLMDVDPFVTIGVHDRSSFISAESFLVGRLLQVTTSGDEGQRNVAIL